MIWPSMAQRADSTEVHGQLTTGVAVMSVLGTTQALGWTAPSVEYRINEHLTLRGGFALVGGLLPGCYELQSLEAQRVSVRRRGTRVGMAWAAGEWAVNERLKIWGSVARWSGMAENWWTNGSEPVAVTAFHGGLSYRLGNESSMEMHFHFVHDRYGNNILGLGGYPYYGILTPEMDLWGGRGLY